jgi:hypothetical protein
MFIFPGPLMLFNSEDVGTFIFGLSTKLGTSPPLILFIESDNESVPVLNLGILFILFLYLKSMML